MAVPVWISNNGDWGSTASWSTGLVPVSTDSVVFDESSQQPVTAGLDQNAVVLDQLTIKRGYGGNIGCPGQPLIIQVDSVAAGVTKNAIFAGTGRWYFQPEVGNFCDIIVDDGTLFLDGAGRARNLFCRGGFTQVSALTSLTGRGMVLGIGAKLEVLEAAGSETGPAVMVCTAGTYVNARAGVSPALIIVSGGIFSQFAILPAGVDLYVFEPGRFRYLPTTVPGTAPDLFALTGVTDLGLSPFASSWTDIIIGPQAGVQGTPHSGGFPTGATVSIDLREQFP